MCVNGTFPLPDWTWREFCHRAFGPGVVPFLSFVMMQNSLPSLKLTWPMKIHHFDGIYWERLGFSWAMLVSGRVSERWQRKYFWNFHPENWGRWTHFDDHIFQLGWFNHQLVTSWRMFMFFAGPSCEKFDYRPTVSRTKKASDAGCDQDD